MTDRIFKFYGQAFAATTAAAITVKFNGVEVFSGPVATDNSPVPTSATDTTSVLFEYVGTTDLSGNIPFELHVTNGTVFFGAVEANYSVADRPNPKNPVNLEPTVIVSPENSYTDVNQNLIETDGKINVKINGVDQIRNVINLDQLGDWWYAISQNETFTCDIFVDPARVITEITV
jgi:hypothetical protein